MILFQMFGRIFNIMETNNGYFEFAFEACPYCESKNITKLEYGVNLMYLGAHRFANLECKDCKRDWSTSNQIKINWKVPEKEIK